MTVSNKFTQFQQIKFDIFKEQNPENGRFDVTFEVEGKLLYAHKTMLNLVSDTFDAMLSDRWKSKDQPIKIQVYSYDNFYQFLTFLYSAQCQLTDSNIYAMVDIAEFYGVNLFKTYCDEFLSAMTISTQNIFSLIKLAEKYSMIQLKSSTHAFICKKFHGFIQCDDYLKLGKSVFYEIIVCVKDEVKPETLFLAVLIWAQQQAINKNAANPYLNINETIKNEFSDFLPHIAFNKMEMYFLLESVVPRGFIFPTLDELSKILCNRYPKTKVRITNIRGESLHGDLIPDKNVIQQLKSSSTIPGISDGRNCCYWPCFIRHPSTPSPIKYKGLKWYLVSDVTTRIRIKRSGDVLGSDYLLAQLDVEPGQRWVGTHNATIEVYRDL